MNTKKITGTDLAVSQICLGMMSFGDPKWAAWVRDGAFGNLVVKTALDRGINFFDTADVYSFGESERILGRAIKAHARRDQVVLATKFGLAKGIDVQGLRREHVISSAEDSLRRLDTDYIDLYQMHGWDTGVPIEETLEALTALQRSGKIRYAGGSNSSPGSLRSPIAPPKRGEPRVSQPCRCSTISSTARKSAKCCPIAGMQARA